MVGKTRRDYEEATGGGKADGGTGFPDAVVGSMISMRVPSGS